MFTNIVTDGQTYRQTEKKIQAIFDIEIGGYRHFQKHKYISPDK